MTEIIVLSEQPPSTGIEAILLDVCFTAAFGDFATRLRGDCILSYLDQGKIVHLGTYDARFQSMPIRDEKGVREGYAVTPIPPSLADAVDAHVQQYNHGFQKMYRWTDTSGFELSKEFRPEH